MSWHGIATNNCATGARLASRLLGSRQYLPGDNADAIMYKSTLPFFDLRSRYLDAYFGKRISSWLSRGISGLRMRVALGRSTIPRVVAGLRVIVVTWMLTAVMLVTTLGSVYGSADSERQLRFVGIGVQASYRFIAEHSSDYHLPIACSSAGCSHYHSISEGGQPAMTDDGLHGAVEYSVKGNMPDWLHLRFDSSSNLLVLSGQPSGSHLMNGGRREHQLLVQAEDSFGRSVQTRSFLVFVEPDYAPEFAEPLRDAVVAVGRYTVIVAPSLRTPSNGLSAWTISSALSPWFSSAVVTEERVWISTMIPRTNAGPGCWERGDNFRTPINLTLFDKDQDRLHGTFWVTVQCDKVPTALASIPDQVWSVGQAVELELPATIGGNGALTYTLLPELPAGVGRQGFSIAGVPSSPFPTTRYTWVARDVDGSRAVQLFTITVRDGSPGTDPNSGEGEGVVDGSGAVSAPRLRGVPGGLEISWEQPPVSHFEWPVEEYHVLYAPDIPQPTTTSFSDGMLRGMADSVRLSSKSITLTKLRGPLKYSVQVIAYSSMRNERGHLFQYRYPKATATTLSSNPILNIPEGVGGPESCANPFGYVAENSPPRVQIGGRFSVSDPDAFQLLRLRVADELWQRYFYFHQWGRTAAFLETKWAELGDRASIDFEELVDQDQCGGNRVTGDTEEVVVFVPLEVTDDYGGRSVAQVPVGIRDVAEPPLAPENLTINLEIDPAVVTWDAAINTGPPISHYEIQYRALASGSSEWIGHPVAVASLMTAEESTRQVPSTWPPIAVTTLSLNLDPIPLGSFDLRVRARNAEGTGVWSAVKRVLRADAVAFVEGPIVKRQIAENAPAGTPIGDPLKAVSANGRPLQFSLPVPTADQFKVSTNGQLLVGSRGHWDFEAFAGADPVIEVVVRATSDSGESADATVQVEVVDDRNEPPLAPGPLIVLADEDRDAQYTSIHVSWSVPENSGRPDVSAYEVQLRHAQTNGVWTKALWCEVYVLRGGERWRPGTPKECYLASPNSVWLRALTAGVTYDFRVRAKNGDGYGGWSPVLTVDERPHRPQFVGRSAWRTDRVVVELVEGARPEQPVGEPFVATLPDSQVPTYHLEGDLANAFDISETGQLLTIPGIDYSANLVSRYWGWVVASNAYLPARLPVAVNVVPAPVTTVPAPTDVRIGERGADHLTVRWTDTGHYGHEVLAYELPGYYTDGDTTSELESERFIGRYAPHTRGTSPGCLRRSNVYMAVCAFPMHGLRSGTTYRILVRAADIGVWSEPVLGTTIQPPVFAEGSSAIRSLPENTVAGSTIGTPLRATGGGGREIRYGTSANSTNWVTVDTSSGQLYVGPDAKFDYESQVSHTVEIRADDGEASATIAVSIGVTDVAEPPLAPTQLSVRTRTDSSLTIEWRAPDNDGRPSITGYEFEMRDRIGGQTQAITPSRQTDVTATLGELEAGQQYWVRLRALNSDGAGSWSEWISGTALAASVANPGLPAIGPRPHTGAMVFARSIPENTGADVTVGDPILSTWPGTLVAGFGVCLSGENCSSVRPPFSVDPGTTQLRTIAGATLDHETRPFYNLVLVGAFQTSDPNTYIIEHLWVTVTITDISEPPFAPTGLVAAERQSDSMLIRWMVPASQPELPITGYEFRRYDAMSDTILTITPMVSGPDWAEFDGLISDQEYQLAARAKNDEGSGAWSEWLTVRTLAGAPEPPVFVEGSLIQRELVERNSARLETVGAPVQATSGVGNPIEYELTGEIAGHFSIDRNSGQIYTKASGVSYDHEGQSLHTGRVLAHDGSVTSAATLQITITDTNEPGLPPWRYWVEARHGNTVRVKWRHTDDPHRPPVESFEFEARMENEQTFVALSATESLRSSAKFDGLHASAQYVLRMRAVNAEGAGPWTPTFDTERVDNLPRFVDGSKATRSINEGLSELTLVGSPVTATTISGRAVKYSLNPPDSHPITSGQYWWAECFEIDADTGQISASDQIQLRYYRGNCYNHEYYRVHHGSVYAYVPGTGTSNSIRVEINIADIDEPPPPPKQLSMHQIRATAIKLRWNVPDLRGQPTDIDFDFRVRTTDSREFESAQVEESNLGNTWWLDGWDYVVWVIGLNPGLEYEVQVRATNHEGTSAWQSVVGRTEIPRCYVSSGYRLPAGCQWTLEFEPRRDTWPTKVFENAVAGTEVTRFASHHRHEAGKGHFELIEGGQFGFDLEARTGVLRVGPNLNLDFESWPWYFLVVQSTDQFERRRRIEFSVQVLDRPEPPLAPNNLRISRIGRNELEIDWDDPDMMGRPPVTRYRVEYRDTGSHLPPQYRVHHEGRSFRSITEVLKRLRQLTADTEYAIRVRAASDEGLGEWSSEVFARTLAGELERRVLEHSPVGTAIGAPLGTSVVGATNFRFAEPSRASGFDLDSRTGQLRVGPGLVTDFEDPARSRFIVRVRADAEQGHRSEMVVNIVVDDAPDLPIAPSLPTLLSATQRQLVFLSQAPDMTARPPVRRYQFEFRQRDHDAFQCCWEPLQRDSSGNVMVTLEGLRPDTEYLLRVRAHNSEGWGKWSVEGVGRTMPIATTQIRRRVLENAPAGYKLGVPIGNGYLRTGTVTFSMLRTASTMDFAVDPQTGQLSLETAGVLDHETADELVFTVVASKPNGDETHVFVIVSVLDVAERPLTPEEPIVLGFGSQGLTIGWEVFGMADRPRATGYDIEFRPWSEESYTLVHVGAGNGPQGTISGLAADTLYLFRVRAINRDGVGPWSIEGSGRTLATLAGVIVSSTGMDPVTGDSEWAVGGVEVNRSPIFSHKEVAWVLDPQAAAGTLVGIAGPASDANGGDTLLYSLSGDGAEQFEIDSSTAQITVGVTGLNLSPGNSAAGYTLIVSVSDGRDLAGNHDSAVDASMRVLINGGNPLLAASSTVFAHALGVSSGGGATDSDEANDSVQLSPGVLQQLSMSMVRNVGIRLSERFRADGTERRMAVAGRAVALGEHNSLDADAGGIVMVSPFRGEGGSGSWGGDLNEMLRDSEFATPLSLASDSVGAATRWAMWGGGEHVSATDLTAADREWHAGHVEVTHVGVEARTPSGWLAGMAFHRGVGELTISLDQREEAARWDGGGVHSYGQWSPSERGQAWGIAGAQTGELRLPEEASAVMQTHLFAAGTDYWLRNGEQTRIGLRGRTELRRLRASLHDAEWAESLPHVADSVQLGVHGRSAISLGANRFEVYGELKVHGERGDLDAGTATQVVGGIRHTGLPWGWELDANAEHAEPLHGAGRVGHRFALTLRRPEQFDHRGLSAEVRRRWSSIRNAHATSAWWDDESEFVVNDAEGVAPGWAASLQFGVPVANGRQVMSPYGQVNGEPSARRELRVGLKLDPISSVGVWQVDLFGEQDRDGSESNSKVGLDASIRF